MRITLEETKTSDSTNLKKQIWQIGRYTIVEIIDSDGVKGIGISRRSQGDEPNGIGEEIAEGRACKAIEKKKKGLKIHNILMG